MLIKNSTASIIASLCYVMFSETLVSVIGNISTFSVTASSVAEWCIRHSIYGMTKIISSTSVSTNLAILIVVNALVVIFLLAAIGLMAFRKYEL